MIKRFLTNTAAKFLAFCLAALLSVISILMAFATMNFAEQGCIPGQRYEDSYSYHI